MNKKNDKKTLLWLLILITFILLIIIWYFYLKITPQRKIEKDEIFEKIKNSEFEIKEKFKDFLNEIKNLKISNTEKELEKKQKGLTEEKIEKLKEKVLEYINKKEQRNED